MIYSLIKRILLSFAAIGLLYAILQMQTIQIVILNNLVKLLTPYEITSIQLKNTAKFPFKVNLNELVISKRGQVVATFKGVSWKIPDFNFSKIILEVNEASITKSESDEKFDFGKISPSGIAYAVHSFTNYLQWFENISITKLAINKDLLNAKLKRFEKESIITISNNGQDLNINLASSDDHAALQISGFWLGHKLNVDAKIYENSINFTSNSDITTFVSEPVAKFLGNEVVITGSLVKDNDWQLRPLKIITENGHVLEGECYIKDPNNVKLNAKLRADEKNTASIDVSISLLPFEINGSSDIVIEDLQKFLKPFLPDAKGNLNLHAQFTKFKGFESGGMKLQGEGLIQSHDFYLPINTDVDLNDGLGHGTLSVSNKLVKGHYQNHPIEAVINFNSNQKELQVEKLKLHVHDLQIALLKPSTYDWQKGMSFAQMQFCEGMVEVRDLKFSESNAESSCTVSLRNIQIGALKILFGQETVKGLLNGQLKKLPNMPLVIKMDLTNGSWQKLQGREIYKVLNNLSANLEGNLDNSKFTWKISIHDQDKINLQSSGHADLTSATGDGNLKGLVKLKLLTDWLGTGDRIFGDIDINLHGKGSLENLVFDGSVNAHNGLYEHNEVGTFYQDITIRTKAQGRKLIITKFDGKDITNSNDPNYGQLRGEGWVDFSNILSPVFHVPLYLNHLRISQNDSFTSDASGSLLIAGIGADVNCKGEVTLENAVYFISENSEKNIPGIIDQKINKDSVQEKNSGTAFPLDILVHAPLGSFKVMGGGADAAMFGDIYVKKSIVNPFLVGSVEIYEGTLDVLGKVLKITRGIITFVDDDRNNPRLDIKAVKDLGDSLIVAIEIKGTGQDTILEFTSAPAMAKEEVLALLLFGKKLGEVSVLQSIQLAELTKSKHSNKAGFFEKLRSGLGFDQFEFKTTTSGGAAENDKDATPAERAAGKTSQAVRIGKEFGKIQVGIEQGAGSETSKLIVSTPLGKHLALQGDVGGAQNSGVGISWIKRY
ncbi:MAG: translocation/assembly module TamB domain-containing protein [Proteobacteria bacterium]|nr:translocation/assembly module TamB domain-containing protein [Pseudomonadota bacterium]